MALVITASCKLIGLSLTGIYSGFLRYIEILYSIAKDEGTEWTDNADQAEHVDENFIDRVHFSRSGAEDIAMHFLPAVRTQIALRHPEPR